MREWWKEEGQHQYPYVHILGDEGDHDFLIFWVWTWDEMYIGVLDSFLGEFVFTTIVEPQEKTDVTAFQQALDFIHRWLTGEQTEKELKFMPRENPTVQTNHWRQIIKWQPILVRTIPALVLWGLGLSWLRQ